MGLTDPSPGPLHAEYLGCDALHPNVLDRRPGWNWSVHLNQFNLRQYSVLGKCLIQDVKITIGLICNQIEMSHCLKTHQRVTLLHLTTLCVHYDEYTK